MSRIWRRTVVKGCTGKKQILEATGTAQHPPMQRILPDDAALAAATAAIAAERAEEHLAERVDAVQAALRGPQAGDKRLQRELAAALRARDAAVRDRDADAVLRAADVEAARPSLQEAVAAKEAAWQSRQALVERLDADVAQKEAALQASRDLQGEAAAKLADDPELVKQLAKGGKVTLPDIF